jgi:hypothetical protein
MSHRSNFTTSHRIFKAGVWLGTYARGGKDHPLNLQLEFYPGGKENKFVLFVNVA